MTCLNYFKSNLNALSSILCFHTRFTLRSHRTALSCPKFRQHFKLFSSSTSIHIFSPDNKLRVANILDKSTLKPKFLKPGEEINKAGVLVPLCVVDGKPSILFTLRSNLLSGHSGQVSFPGGKMDLSDGSAVETALRETEEEVGIDRNSVDVWGQLHPLPSNTKGMMVTPVIAYCGHIQVTELNFNCNEVSDVFSGSIDSLCDKDNVQYTSFRSGITYRLPVFLGQKHKIWGLTAIILHQTLEIIAPELFIHKYKFPGV